MAHESEHNEHLLDIEDKKRPCENNIEQPHSSINHNFYNEHYFERKEDGSGDHTLETLTMEVIKKDIVVPINTFIELYLDAEAPRLSPEEMTFEQWRSAMKQHLLDYVPKNGQEKNLGYVRMLETVLATEKPKDPGKANMHPLEAVEKCLGVDKIARGCLNYGLWFFARWTDMVEFDAGGEWKYFVPGRN